MSASTTPTLRPARASATARLAVSVDLPTPPLPEPITTTCRRTLSAMSATRTSATPSSAPTTCSSSRCSSAASARPSPVASATSVATPSVRRTERMRGAMCGGSCCSISVVGVIDGLLAVLSARCSENVTAPVFCGGGPYNEAMERLGGWFERIALTMAGKRSPWGKPSGNNEGGEGEGPDDDAETPPTGEDPPRGPRNPWLPGGGNEERPRRSANIEDIFRHRGPEGPRRAKGGGPGGPNFRLPPRPGGGSWLPIIALAVVGIWLFMTAVHQIGAKEQAIVTTFGQYSRTLQPGLKWTLPWPIQNVDKEAVSEFRVET